MASSHLNDDEHLSVLGYENPFNRSMSLWANFALAFTYLSPLVGVYSLFALALSVGGPPSIWWIVIVGLGQTLVALVFGEVVSQFPIHGGIYPWARRLGPERRGRSTRYGDARVEGVRQVVDDIAVHPDLDATAIQTVGINGWDGLILARR